jgi:hypothetical protein
MMASYIDDGYTRDDGYIAAAPAAQSGERLWEPLEFSYRIATRTEIIRHDAEVRNALKDEDQDPECAVKAEQLACRFVADRVKAWNLKNRGNHAVPVSVDACSRINAALFGRLYRIIRGSDLSDPKPPAVEPPPGDLDLQKN